MKKLLSFAFIAVITFVAASSSAEAQTGRNNRNVDQRQNTSRNANYNTVVRTFTRTKNVVVGKKHYLETYQVTVFRNGKNTSRLISRVEIKNKRNKNVQSAVQTSYQTVTVRENGRSYRVTYKITKYRNGRIERQVIRKERVR